MSRLDHWLHCPSCGFRGRLRQARQDADHINYFAMLGRQSLRRRVGDGYRVLECRVTRVDAEGRVYVTGTLPSGPGGDPYLVSLSGTVIDNPSEVR